MSNVLITFGGAAFDETTRNTVEAARDFGADEIIVYDDRWLMQTEFYRVNQWWWHKSDALNGNPNRGFGWFVWKPYVIADAMSRGRNGVVLFIDGDTWPIADLTPIFETARRDGTMLFNAVGCNHARWCKRDCFMVMGQDEPQYRDREHACARFMAFNVADINAASLLHNWQKFCLNPGANTMDASVLAPEHPEFYEHRCEQAILTNLAHKYGHRLYREACQAGKDQPQDQELYHQLFEHQWANGDRADLSGSKYRNVE